MDEVVFGAEIETCSGMILFTLGGAACSLLRLEVERVGFAKEELSRMEKGLEQFKVGAGILSRISKTTFVGRANRGLSEGGDQGRYWMDALCSS